MISREIGIFCLRRFYLSLKFIHIWCACAYTYVRIVLTGIHHHYRLGNDDCFVELGKNTFTPHNCTMNLFIFHSSFFFILRFWFCKVRSDSCLHVMWMRSYGC